MTKNIIIPVNSETANTFNNLPLEKRNQIQNFLSLQLETALKSKQSLLEIMDEISDFIITGDNDLLVLNPFRNIQIITPKSFLELI